MAKKMAKPAKPVMRHMCTLGTLVGYGGKKGEWSVAKKLKRIKKAGFDGFLGRVHLLERKEVEDSGLIFACTTDMGGAGEVKPKFEAIKEYGARCVNGSSIPPMAFWAWPSPRLTKPPMWAKITPSAIITPNKNGKA